MSIRIDASKCVGCHQCIDVCPGTLLALDANRKAEMQYPRDCWGCASCVKACHFGAIEFYLGADIGGRGSTLRIETEGQYMHWIVSKENGETNSITVDTKEANKY